jgi:hypothetical protein
MLGIAPNPLWNPGHRSRLAVIVPSFLTPQAEHYPESTQGGSQAPTPGPLDLIETPPQMRVLLMKFRQSMLQQRDLR